MIIKGKYQDIGFILSLDRPISSDKTRELARRLSQAADEADRMTDGVYRVSFPDSPEGTVTYRRVVAGKLLDEHGVAVGYPEAIGAIILERIGDIP